MEIENSKVQNTGVRCRIGHNMRLTQVFTLLEQRDPTIIYTVGDTHADRISSYTGGQNLAQVNATVGAIASQAQSVPDNSIVLYSGGYRDVKENGVVTASIIKKQIKSMQARGCYVMYVVFPMIELDSEKPSIIPNDGKRMGFEISVDGKPQIVDQATLAQLRAPVPAGQKQPLVVLAPMLKQTTVYKNIYKYDYNYNRVREQIRRAIETPYQLNTSDLDPKDPELVHCKPQSYSAIASAVRTAADAEIQKRASTNLPIGSDMPKSGSADDLSTGGWVGDLFGIFGSIFDQEEEQVPDNDIIGYDKDGQPIEPATGQPYGSQPYGAQVNLGDMSQGLVNYIKTKEGYSKRVDSNDPKSDVTPYDDFGQFSIGFGTKARSRTERLTYEQAEQRLAQNIQRFRNAVLKRRTRYGYKWSESSVDALTSFAYNLGEGKIDQVTANGSRSNKEIAEKMLEYNRAGGRRFPGLAQRRREEMLAFLQGQNANQLAFRPGARTTATA